MFKNTVRLVCSLRDLLCDLIQPIFAAPPPPPPADNWWCFVDDHLFTRMVDMYKSIVVFMLTGGRTLLVPVFYENYFVATLRLLEKLHKVSALLLQTGLKQLRLRGGGGSPLVGG